MKSLTNYIEYRTFSVNKKKPELCISLQVFAANKHGGLDFHKHGTDRYLYQDLELILAPMLVSVVV